MAKKLLILLSLCFFVLSFSFVIADETKKAEDKKEAKKEESKYEYIGAKKCRMCHKKDETYPTWEKTPHASAMDVLNEEQQKNKECLTCHATGMDKKGNLLGGVQCEACHGPGSEYKSKKIMEDRELAIKNGLLIPNEETCVQCHDAEKAPEICKVAKEFDFEKMEAKGVHKLTPKEKAEG